MRYFASVQTGPRKLLIGIIAALLVAGAGFRALQAVLHPIATGETRKSPDSRFEASAMEMYDETFLGAKRHYFEFRLRDGAEERRVVTDPLPGPYFGSRSSHRVVYWAPDSKSVRFVFDGVEILMKVPAAASSGSPIEPQQR